MAVNSETSRVQYVGNNSTVTAYTVPFAFLENSHLLAIATDAAGVESSVTLANHTGVGNPSGGTVTTTVAVPATSTLTIFRSVPATQTTSYAEGGDFPAASHERALDKLTMLGQQNARSFGRGVRVSEAAGALNEFVAKANTVLGLDASKQPKAMTLEELKQFLGLTGVTLSVPAGMKTAADAGERALAVPDFTGQLLTQRDTSVIYVSTGTSAGNWTAVTLTVLLSGIASGLFTADATGRGKFASGFVNAALIEAAAVTLAKIADGAFTADTTGRAKFANGFLSTALLADAAVTAAKTAVGFPVQVRHTSTNAGLVVNVLGSVSALPTTSNTLQFSELATSITPSSSSNTVLARAVMTGSATAGGAAGAVVALFRNNDATALTATYVNLPLSSTLPIVLEFMDSPATTSATTYRIRASYVGSSGWNLNLQAGGTGWFSTAKGASLTLTEIRA